MVKKHHYRDPRDSGNHTGNPLRGYRMAMLSHGFRPDGDEHEMNPDETESLTYSVGPLHRQASLLRVLTEVVVLVAAVVIAIAVFT